MKKRLKINGFIIVLAFLLLAMFPAVFLRSATQAFWDEAAEVFGIAFILLGQLLRASARGYKSENSGNGHLLIQGGPYALVRNPMYLGILSIGLGIVLMLFNWWVIAIFLCVFILRYILLIFKEEKKLSDMFPGAYEDYRKRVPRLLPSPAALSQKEIAEYLPLKAPWLKKELGSILAVLLTVLSLHGWEDIKTEGMRAYLDEAILFFAVAILFIFIIIYLIRGTDNPKKYASTESKNTL